MMMDNWIRGPAAVLGLAAFLAMSPGEADAALVNCGPSFPSGGADLTDKVHDGSGTSAVSACQYDDETVPGDVADIGSINDSGFFSTTDWVSHGAGKVDLPDGTLSGLWEILDPDFDAFDYMIVFKDGQDSHLIGFLFDESVASGGWDTPYVDPPFDGTPTEGKEVSHYHIVKRGSDGPGDPPGDPVPEPGVLGLMGLGLLGLGLAAYTRRRRGA